LAPVPVTAWIPLIIIFAGIGESSKSSILAVGAFFPVYFATIAGISMSDSKLVEVARLHGKSKLQVLKTVLFPCSIPYVFQGLKAALGLSWVLLIVAEVIASRAGLGWLMWDARNFGRPDEMIVGMITAGVLGASTAYILSRIERFALYWKPKYTGDR
jgi:sulfonate transport system permease protein